VGDSRGRTAGHAPFALPGRGVSLPNLPLPALHGEPVEIDIHSATAPVLADPKPNPDPSPNPSPNPKPNRKPNPDPDP